MAGRKLEVQFVGDTASLERAFGRANSQVDQSSNKFKQFGKVAALGIVGGVATAGVAVKGFIEAAKNSEVSSTRMQAQLKASGISYDKYGGRIDSVIAKQSALAGLDDEDLQDSFTNIVRVTGDVNEALKLNGLAADIARAKGIDLSAASKMVAKAAGGQATAFSRVGVTMKKGATAQDAIAAAQKKFAGQAEAYGKTAAGAQERFGVAVEGVQEALGAALLPILTKVTNGVSDFVMGMQSGEGTGGKLVTVVKDIASATAGVVGWFRQHETVSIALAAAIGTVLLAFAGFKVLAAIQAAIVAVRTAMLGLNAAFLANPAVLIVAGIAALVAGLVIAYRESETFRKIVNALWDAVKAVAGWLIDAGVAAFNAVQDAVVGAWNWIKRTTETVWPAIKAILEGVWLVIKTVVTTYFNTYKTIITTAWDVIKTVTTTAWNTIKGVVTGVWNAIETAATTTWGLIRTAVVNPVTSAVSAVRTALGEDGLKGWLTSRWSDIKSAASSAWDTFKSNIVTPVGDAISSVKDVLGKGKDGLITWLEDRAADIEKAAKALAKPFIAAFGTMKDAVDPVLTVIGKILGAIKDVVEWIGKIKIPKIDIPFVGGGSGTGDGRVGPAPKVSGVDGFNPVAARFGNVVTSGYRQGDDGWHGQNRARDYAGGDMMGFARFMAATYGSKLLELIYTPLGFGVKNGQQVPMSFFGSDVAADHYDHVHVAFRHGGIAPGGVAMVGEAGPELVHLPSGSHVYSRPETERMLGGSAAPVFDVRVYVGDREITDIVRTEIHENERGNKGAYSVGLMAA